MVHRSLSTRLAVAAFAFVGPIVFTTVVPQCAPAAHAATPSFNGIVDFGDSLSDAGNDFAASSFAHAFNPAVPVTPGMPGYSNGHFSNGPTFVERLGVSLGLGAPTPSFTGGSDYAYGGVTSGTGTTNGLPNVEQQINTYTPTPASVAGTLFTVLGGANDIFGLFTGASTTTPAQAAANIAAGVQTLYNDGARNILVANLPNLGLIPRFRGTPAERLATAYTVQFNTALATDLAAIDAASPGLNQYNLDLFGLFNSAVANPSAFGLTNVTDRAYTGDDTFAGNGTAVADPSGYLFWDAVHPTATGHQLIANAAFAAIPEPATGTLVAAFLTLASARRNRSSGHASAR